MPGTINLRVPPTLAHHFASYGNCSKHYFAAPATNTPCLSSSSSSSSSSAEWELVSLPLGTAFAVAITWILVGAFVRRRSKSIFGDGLDNWGMPRFCAASKMWTQLLVLPSLLLLALRQYHFRLEEWQLAAGSAFFTVDGQRYWDWAFMYIFACFMLEDMVLLSQMSAMMRLHHVGCH